VHICDTFIMNVLLLVLSIQPYTFLSILTQTISSHRTFSITNYILCVEKCGEQFLAFHLKNSKDFLMFLLPEWRGDWNCLGTGYDRDIKKVEISCGRRLMGWENSSAISCWLQLVPLAHIPYEISLELKSSEMKTLSNVLYSLSRYQLLLELACIPNGLCRRRRMQ